MLKKEQIESRRDELKKGLESLDLQIKQLEVNKAATDGAIQDCEYWLEQFDKDTE